jgi:uncharacterized repeat protein (TIGR01451 family)
VRRKTKIQAGSILVLAAAFALIGQIAVATADEGTGPNLDQFTIKYASSITLNPTPEFSGKVTSAKDLCSGQARCTTSRDCVGGRLVRIKNTITGAIIAETKTKADGSYAVSNSFTGQAFAKVRRETIVADADHDGDGLIICKRNHSPVVTFGTTTAQLAPKADLALTITANPGVPNLQYTATYTIVVTNNGPNDAQNVVVTDTPSDVTTFNPASSDSRCHATETGKIVCNLGGVPAGASVSLVLAFTYIEQCQPQTDMESATVTADTPDPNIANNGGSASKQIPGDENRCG